MPLTTARLRALDETSDFSSDDLVAAGFQHPQTTRQGLEELVGAPIDIISTGPDREETILLRHPFGG